MENPLSEVLKINISDYNRMELDFNRTLYAVVINW
jgi:hypothetical protein